MTWAVVSASRIAVTETMVGAPKPSAPGSSLVSTLPVTVAGTVWMISAISWFSSLTRITDWS
ncbi:hypothetical protein D3C83_241870 [compost metagenome]